MTLEPPTCIVVELQTKKEPGTKPGTKLWVVTLHGNALATTLEVFDGLAFSSINVQMQFVFFMCSVLVINRGEHLFSSSLQWHFDVGGFRIQKPEDWFYCYFFSSHLHLEEPEGPWRNFAG